MSPPAEPPPAGAAPIGSLPPGGDPAGTGAPGRGRPLLRQREFAALWWAQLISIFGDRLTYLALVGLIAGHTGQFRDARSPLLLSVLANMMLWPVLLLAPFAGAWVDRWNLKRVLVIADLLRAALVLLIPALYALNHRTDVTFALVFVMFTCNVFFLPAKSAITPELVAPAQLVAANGLLTVAGVAATAVGALAGGWVIDHWGWAAALRVDAATYAFSVAAIVLIRYRPGLHRASAARVTLRGYLREVGEGGALLARHPAVGLGLIALAAVWVGGGFLHVAGNLHIQRAASAPGMERVGLLLAALGLGSALGTWWLNARGRAWPRPVLIAAGLVTIGVGLAVFAASRRFAVFAGAAFGIGIAAAPAFVLSETLLQLGSAPAQRGRVFSLRDFLMRLVFLLAVTAAGWLTRSFGTRTALMVCAALLALAGVLALAWGRLHPELMRAERPRNTGSA